MEIDSLNETRDLETSKSVDNSVENDLTLNGINSTINDVEESLAKNITEKVEKESFFDKFDKNVIKDLLVTGVKTVAKGYLKSKFGISYTVFNSVDSAISSLIDGNFKDTLKKGTDAVISGTTKLDGISKTTIKKLKNSLIDGVVDNSKNELATKQTKILNRIAQNCNEFDIAFKSNDVNNIKKKANSIKKDLSSVLPIKDTIDRAQNVLDKFELWKNKGEQSLSEDELSTLKLLA